MFALTSTSNVFDCVPLAPYAISPVTATAATPVGAAAQSCMKARTWTEFSSGVRSETKSSLPQLVNP